MTVWSPNPFFFGIHCKEGGKPTCSLCPTKTTSSNYRGFIAVIVRRFVLIDWKEKTLQKLFHPRFEENKKKYQLESVFSDKSGAFENVIILIGVECMPLPRIPAPIPSPLIVFFLIRLKIRLIPHLLYCLAEKREETWRHGRYRVSFVFSSNRWVSNERTQQYTILRGNFEDCVILRNFTDSWSFVGD